MAMEDYNINEIVKRIPFEVYVNILESVLV